MTKKIQLFYKNVFKWFNRKLANLFKYFTKEFKAKLKWKYYIKNEIFLGAPG